MRLRLLGSGSRIYVLRNRIHEVYVTVKPQLVNFIPQTITLKNNVSFVIFITL